MTDKWFILRGFLQYFGFDNRSTQLTIKKRLSKTVASRLNYK